MDGQGRSGSQKRKVTARFAINCTRQKAAILEKIDATGLSPSAMCLAVLLDALPTPPPLRRYEATGAGAGRGSAR